MSNFYLCSSAALDMGLSKSAFKIYTFLALSANSITRGSYYKRSNIAARCNVSESTVVRACRELCRKGFLEIRQRFLKRGQQTSNLYILLDNPQLKMVSTEPQDVISSDPKNSTNAGKDMAQEGISAKLQLFRCNPTAFHAHLSANVLKVYSYLSLRAGADGYTFPSKKDIAAGCGISVSTVSRGLKVLLQAGLIDIKPQTRANTFGNNGSSENCYILNTKPERRGNENKSTDSSAHSPAEDVAEPTAPPPMPNLTPLRKRAFCNLSIPSVPLRNLLLGRTVNALVFSVHNMTPSPMSQTIPQRTIPKKKNTLKQRKKYFFPYLTKWKNIHCVKKSELSRIITAKNISPPDSG
jgi:DNA-binding MurR/RpiR family transcriptional regulator